MAFRQRSGPPSWFVLLLGIAIVFGVYYLWLGLRGFMATGLTTAQTTRQAIERATATAVSVSDRQYLAPTALPTFTPVPACQDFVVLVRSAIIRSAPSTESGIVDTVRQGDIVCVIAREPDSDWYVLDRNTLTRRLEAVYMHEDLVRALNPTPTPTLTFTPSPTPTPSATPSPAPQPTLRMTASDRQTATPTMTASPSLGSVSL